MMVRLPLLLTMCCLVMCKPSRREDVFQRILQVLEEEENELAWTEKKTMVRMKQRQSYPKDPVYDVDPNPGLVVSGVIVPSAAAYVQTDLEHIGEEKQEYSDIDLNNEENELANVDDTRSWKSLRNIKRNLEKGLYHNKRFMTNQQHKLWPKCVIPYTFDGLTQEAQDGVRQAMQIYEKWTCLRFYEWNETISDIFDLGHANRLHFVKRNGCWSFVGMLNKGSKGQEISCCSGRICVHELGHVLGFQHEQTSPLRDDYIRINTENIASGKTANYNKKDPAKWRTFPWNYDFTSVMHYQFGSYSSNGKPTMTVRDPRDKYLVMEGDDSYFYFLRELQTGYDCKGLKCPEDTRVCENEGYITYKDNECVCRCIKGLNSATNCSTLEKNDPRLVTISWPTAPFSMLKVNDEDCPKGSKHGTVTHKGHGGWTGSRHDAAGFVNDQTTKMEFCTFDNSIRSGEVATFSPGEYCINRVGGSCPEGFKNGYEQYDDKDGAKSLTSGIVPDGVYDNDTRLEFCCRNDGNKDYPIELPVTQRFSLWRTNYWGCQKVKDTVSIGTQYFGFVNVEPSNISSYSTPLPLSYHHSGKSWLYYCIYQPIRKDCGSIITLTEDSPWAEIVSPNYPDPYGEYTECTWVIKSPINTTIVLDFPDFEIPKDPADPAKCQDKLEIRSILPGQPGIPYCGSRYKSSTVSDTNTLSLVLHSMGPTSSYRRFKAKVKIAKKDVDLCYSSDDKGTTYRGAVNFTQNMKICLPWSSVSHCPRNTFQLSDRFNGLEENYCRKAGPGLRPFCYTMSEGCVPDYCDVCGIGSCYDVWDNCTISVQANPKLCTDKAHIESDGTIGCALSCGMCSMQSSEKVSEITCPPPTTPEDGIALDALKTSYNVGETVRFQCSSNVNYDRNQTCTTAGTWEGQGPVCQGCPKDWSIHNRQCYKFFPEVKPESAARELCLSFNNGGLATLKTKEDTDFVTKLLPSSKTSIWLGLNDKETEGTFLWNDGTSLSLTVSNVEWRKKQPDDWRGQDCVELKGGKLSDIDCESKRAFICQSPIKLPLVCQDLRTDCSAIMSEVPGMCTQFESFAYLSCKLTCNKCHG